MAEYALDDRRYYPSDASGQWTSEQAMPGDFRTARMRKYLEDMDARESAGTSERARVAELRQQLDNALSEKTPQTAPRDLSFMAFLKDAYSGLEPSDIGGIPAWLLSQVDRITGRKEVPQIQGGDLRGYIDNLLRFTEENPDQTMGFMGASAPLNFAKAAKAIQTVGGPAATRGGEGWADAIGKQNPLRKTLDALESGKWGTGESNRIPNPGFGIQGNPSVKRTLQEEAAKRPPSDFDKVSPYDVYKLARGDVKEAHLDPILKDNIEIMLNTEPKLAYRIAADPQLQDAIRQDPNVILRLAEQPTPFSVGMNPNNRNWFRNSYARSLDRPQPGEPEWAWRGGHTEETGDLSRAGWPIPPEQMPHTWQSRIASPVEMPTLQDIVDKIGGAGKAIGRGLGSAGRALGDLESQVGRNVMNQLSPQRQRQVEDFMEDHGLVLPAAKLAATAYGLGHLIPALPSSESTKGQDNPNLTTYDMNDPEGLMRQRRLNEQNTLGDSPYKVFSELFPWNWF